MNLRELREKRAALFSRMQEIRSDVEKNGWNRNTRSEWDRLDEQLGEVTQQLEDRERTGHADQRHAQLGARDDGSVAGQERSTGIPSPAPILREDRPGAVGMPELLTRSDSIAEQWRRRGGAEHRGDHEDLNLTKMVRGMITGRWDDAEAEQRAMTEGVGSAGGYVVPSALAAAVLDLARAKSRCIEAGASTVTMETPTLKVPMLAEDLEGTWHGEGQQIPEDQPGFSVVQMSAHSFATLTLISRELFEDAESTITDAVRGSAAASMALAFDYGALYGTGGPIEPLGLKNWDVGGPFEVSKTELGSGNGATPADYDHLVDGIGELWDRNHEPSGIVLAPRTEVTYAKFKATDDQPLQAPDMVRSVPRYPTKQVPKNLTVGSSNDTSDIFVGDWRHLVFGIRRQPMIMTLDQRYADYGMIGLLLWFRGDTAVLRPDAFEIITGVRAA